MTSSLPLDTVTYDGMVVTVSKGRGAHSPTPLCSGSLSSDSVTYQTLRSVYVPREVPARCLKSKVFWVMSNCMGTFCFYGM